MTDADRRHLDEHGYLVLPGLMPPELLDALRRRVDELFAEEGARPGRSSSRSRARAGWRTWSTKAACSRR